MECFDVLNFPRFAKKVEKYLQNKKNVVPLQSLTKGNGYQWILSGENNIGELAEWSNAAVLKTVDLNGSGGSNPSLSAEHNEKSRQACLNAIFLLCSATPRRRRGGMCKVAKRLRKSRE